MSPPIELDKVELSEPELPISSKSSAAPGFSWKQKGLLLGISVALAAVLAVYLLRGEIFLSAPPSSQAAAPRRAPKAFDLQRALRAARGRFDPASSSFIVPFAFPVRTPSEVRVLSLSLGFGLSGPDPGMQHRLRERIPAIRQAVERELLGPSIRPLMEDVPDHVAQIKNRVLIAASKALKEQNTTPDPGTRRVFIADFLFH